MKRAQHIFWFIVSLVVWLSGPACADREVHVVAVGQGFQTADLLSLPEARIKVDRPGQEVALVLLDAGAVHWRVEATPGTIIGEIVRGGRPSRDSKVSFFDVPMDGVAVDGLPLVYRPLGRDFRALLGSLTHRFGVDRIHGFQGTHRLRGGEIRVDSVNTTSPGLELGYLAAELNTLAGLPDAFRTWHEQDHGGTTRVRFTEDGAELIEENGSRMFPVSSDVPAIFLPASAVYEATTATIYALSYGGPGYIYAVDTKTGRWSVVTSLERYDAVGLLYDPATQQFVTTGAFSRPGQIKVFGSDGVQSSIFVPTTEFPGLTDLFNYGNEHGPPLTPLLYRDGWLLAEARAGDAVRTYAVEIATGAVRLLAYQDD